jgi:hypothetical protein
MDYTRVATVSSLTSSGDHSDTDATFDNAVEKLPISFHEGRKFEDFLRRLELNALLKTGTHPHKLNQLHGLLNTSQALPLMASALLPEEMRPAKEAAVPLSASLPTATDRAAFTTCLCGGDAALAREVLDDEASWDLPSMYTFPPPASGFKPTLLAAHRGTLASSPLSPLAPGFGVRRRDAGRSQDSPASPSADGRSPVGPPSETASPSREVAFLIRLFGDSSNIEGGVRSLCVLLST